MILANKYIGWALFMTNSFGMALEVTVLVQIDINWD